MRPIALRLTAFGSYAGAEFVDFIRLAEHGLFVVSGPTGSGKTTLFDAMTYALYGTLPGDRPDDVRSHHASVDTPTMVELVFEAEGRRYRVKRSPKSERPKSRGVGSVAVAATAEMYEVCAGGDVAMASAKRDVDQRCADLVGLDVEQFQRVVLLPQGKCAQFLLCATGERQTLLQQLFGTRVFARATRLAVERAAELRTKLGEFDAMADHHRLNAFDLVVAVLAGVAPADDPVTDPSVDLDGIEVLIAAAEPLLRIEDATLSTLTVRARAAQSELTTADALCRQWDERVELLNTLQELERAHAAVEADRARAAGGRRAKPAAVAASVVAELIEARMRDAEALQQAWQDLATGFTAAGIADSAATAAGAAVLVERAQARLALDEARLKALQRADDELGALTAESSGVEATLADLAVRIDAARVRVDQHAAAMLELEPLAATTEASRRNAERLGEFVERRTQQLLVQDELASAHVAAEGARSVRARVTAAFITDAAPRLAAELVAQQPCPVCGSLDHPAPAVSRVDGSASRDDLDAALEASRSGDAVVERLAVQLVEHRRALGDQADVDLAVLQSGHHDATEAARAAHGAVAALSDLRLDTYRLQSDAHTLAAQRDEMRPRAAELAVLHVQAVQQVAQLRAAVGDLDPEQVSVQILTLPDLSETVQRLAVVEAARTARDGALAHAELQRDQAVVDSGYPDLAAALGDFVPDDVLTELDVSVTSWDRRRAEVATQLGMLAKVDLGEARPQTDELRTTAHELETARSLASNRLAELRLRLADARSSVGMSRAVLSDSASLRARRDTAERVATMCNGKNRLNIALETWVLAGELERVTEAANVHLALMTRGRYQLERSDGSDDRRRRGGLDLVVLDADTGRPRTPGTLSGGEQFQASLALALGLADVVSQGGSGSGKVFEALFVDEGFGSLDPEALNEAIDALHELHATGRMIGVITHVEAMKRELPTGIEVIVCPDGPGSTLIQP